MPKQPDIAVIYPTTLDYASSVVNRVPHDRWASQSPCDEWTVRQVTNHLINENLWVPELLSGKTIEDVGDRFDGDLTGDDPARAYTESAALARDAAAADGAMEAVCHLSYGDVPGSEYLTHMFLDTLVHSWDIAKGSGQDATLPTDLVQVLFPIAQQVREHYAESGMFGENLEDPSADLQSRALGLLGRRA